MREHRSSKKIVPLSIMLLVLAFSFAGFSGVGLRVESHQALARRAPIEVIPNSQGTFTLSGSPTELAFAKGSSATSTITVTSELLVGTVQLLANVTSTVPNGPSASMSPTSVHLTSNSSATSILTVSASSATPAGHYDINVTAVKGSIVQTIFIDVAVTPLSFVISDNRNVTAFAVYNVKTTGTLSLDSPSNSFTASGSILATEKNSAGTVLFSNSFPISHVPLSSPSAGGYVGRFVLNLHLAFISSDISLNLTAPTSSAPGGATATVQVTRNPDVDLNGAVDQADVNAVSSAQGCAYGQTCYNYRLDLNGDRVINGLDLNIVSAYLGSTDFLADFSMTPSQTSLTIPPGSSSASSVLTFNSIGGLTNNLTLTTVISPAGLSASFSPPIISMASGSTSSTLTLTSSGTTPNGTYTVSVRAKSYSFQRAVSIAVNLFVGFNLTNSPNDAAITAGTSSTFSITVTSINNFAGSVNLASAVSSSGPTTALSPSSLTLTAGGSATSTLTVFTTTSISHGLYLITVTGTAGSELHSTSLDVAVTPLTISINDNENFTGVNVRTTASFSVDSPMTSFTFSGTATVVATNATTGAALFSKTYTITRYSFYYSQYNAYTGYFLLNVPVSPYRLSVDIGLTLTAPTSTAPGSLTVSYLSLNRNLDINGDGTVNQPDFNIAYAAFDSYIGQPNYNPLADINADGQVNIVDIAYISLFFGATDFI